MHLYFSGTYSEYQTPSAGGSGIIPNSCFAILPHLLSRYIVGGHVRVAVFRPAGDGLVQAHVYGLHRAPVEAGETGDAVIAYYGLAAGYPDVVHGADPGAHPAAGAPRVRCKAPEVVG